MTLRDRLRPRRKRVHEPADADEPRGLSEADVQRLQRIQRAAPKDVKVVGRGERQ